MSRVCVGEGDRSRVHLWHSTTCATAQSLVALVRRRCGNLDLSADGAVFTPILPVDLDKPLVDALLDAVAIAHDAILDLLRREARGRRHVSNREPTP